MATSLGTTVSFGTSISDTNMDSVGSDRLDGVVAAGGAATTGFLLFQNGLDKILFQNGTDAILYQGGA